MQNISKVMMAIDLSEYSEMFIEFAANFAKQIDAELIATYVISEMELKTTERIANEYRSFSKNEYVSRLVEENKDKISKIAQKIEKLNVTVQTSIKVGKIVEELRKEILDKKADIILMASKGRSDIADYVLGSCIRKILHLHLIPVVVFPVY